MFNKDENECCSDTGATDTMWPDYSAFISYLKTPGVQVKLGDGTMLDSPGKSSVKVSLNGKFIILRHVLYVTALQDPLYSLRKHTLKPGCGYFAFHVVTGSNSHLTTFWSFQLTLTLFSWCVMDSIISQSYLWCCVQENTMNMHIITPILFAFPLISDFILFTFDSKGALHHIYVSTAQYFSSSNKISTK